MKQNTLNYSSLAILSEDHEDVDFILNMLAKPLPTLNDDLFEERDTSEPVKHRTIVSKRNKTVEIQVDSERYLDVRKFVY